MQLTLKDFQGWSDASLTLEGFTVVVGPSNRGKSALARATKAILRNGITEGQVRLGTPEARVALSMDEHEIEAVRARRGSATYVVDGAEFAKLGGDIPPVMADWGYQPVEVNGVKIDPVFAGQFDSQFLLSSSPAETSAILNAFSSTERLDKGRKTLKGRVGETDSEAKILGAQISNLETQVADLGTKAITAEELRSSLVAQMAVARQANLQHKALQRLLGALEARREVNKQVVAIDGAALATAGCMQGVTVATQLTLLLSAITRRAQVKKTTTALSTIDPKLDIALKAWLRLERVIRIHTGVGKQEQGKVQLQALDQVQAPMDLAAQRYKVLVRARALMLADPTAVKARAAAVQDLGDELLQVEHKARLATTLHKASLVAIGLAHNTSELSSVQRDIAEIVTERQAAETALESWRTTNRLVTCPQCSHEFVDNQEVHHD